MTCFVSVLVVDFFVLITLSPHTVLYYLVKTNKKLVKILFLFQLIKYLRNKVHLRQPIYSFPFYRWVSLSTFTWTMLGGQLHTCYCFVCCESEQVSLNCIYWQPNTRSIPMRNTLVNAITVLYFRLTTKQLTCHVNKTHLYYTSIEWSDCCPNFSNLISCFILGSAVCVCQTRICKRKSLNITTGISICIQTWFFL